MRRTPVDAGGPHQPGDLVTADVVAGTPGRLPELPGPVDPVVVLPELAAAPDPITASRRPAPTAAGSWSRSRCSGPPAPLRSQDGADGLDPELVAVGVDEGDYFLCWRSSSAPKKLAARFRISLARLSSRISCSSSLIRGDSAVRHPGA